MKVKFHKRAVSLLLAILICITAIPLTAFAGSDIGNEGGNSQHAVKGYEWLYWLDGARLTAISATDGSVAVDSAGNRISSVDWVHNRPGFNSVNYYISQGMRSSYAQLCKQDYLFDEDPKLSLTKNQYKCKIPPAGMPFIVVDENDGGADINAIRSFFSKDNVIQSYCANVYNVDGENYSSSTEAQALYSRLESGELVLAIEPVIFFTYKSKPYGLTVTETALLDKKENSNVKAYLYPLTNNIAPKSMFLEEPHEKLGYPNKIPKPDSRGLYSWDVILNSCLGIGIVWLTPPDPTVYHHIYELKLKIPKDAKPLKSDNNYSGSSVKTANSMK